MMRIVHVKSRSIFQAFNKSSSLDSESVVQLFWFTVSRRKTYPIPLAKFSRRSLVREAIFAFEFSISHSPRHTCSVCNCFLLFSRLFTTQYSVLYFFSFLHHSPNVIVISPHLSRSQAVQSKYVSIKNEDRAHTYLYQSNFVCEYVYVRIHDAPILRSYRV